MLLRGKYDALINVTWDCYDQSNFYISRINIIEWNIITYSCTVFLDCILFMICIETSFYLLFFVCVFSIVKPVLAPR
jgi:hypothetical protein